MVYDVRIESDNTEEVLKAEEKAIEKALTEIGLVATNDAQSLCKVDTGLLRNSITYAVSGKSTTISSYSADKPKKGKTEIERGSYGGQIGNADEKAVYVGTNVEYAPYVEYGFNNVNGGHVAPTHFLKKAIENNRSEFKSIIEKNLGKSP
jgi:hypothetical protein